MSAIDTDLATTLRERRGAVDAAMSRDRGRLLGLWSRWQGKPGNPQLRQAFEQALAASQAQRQARAAQQPAITLDTQLPIAREADRIIALIRDHPVVVIAGETGSGKTTQLPKLCLAAGRGAAGMIGCTQPRRIAARAVAARVAEELNTPLGTTVGFQVRFTDRVGEDSRIKFMTDGILLAEIASDRWLSAYDTIIVDEAHERSLNIDFLLGYLKQLLRKRPDLKLIVTSATIDTERFSRHFDDAPVINVEGRTFPVDVRYRPLEGESGDGDTGDVGRDGERTVNDAIVAAIDEITRIDPRGDVLMFLPGEREIRDAHQSLERRKYRETEVVPLYARLSAADQDRVFNPGPRRRLVLATNVAETSLTVPRIRYVVDPGYARVKRYSPRQKLDRLHIEPISQASANQRMGRCGRIAEGICYRLYAEADFAARPAFTDPEIRRASLSGVILRMLQLGLGRIEEFPFLEAPDERAVADGWQQLLELGAIDVERRLTAIGRQMARLPVDVKLARMLVAAQQHGCLREMIIIAAFLGIRIRASARRKRARPPITRMRCLPMRARSSSASCACGTPTGRYTKTSPSPSCAIGAAGIFSASCACASGASCTASCACCAKNWAGAKSRPARCWRHCWPVPARRCARTGRRTVPPVGSCTVPRGWRAKASRIRRRHPRRRRPRLQRAHLPMPPTRRCARPSANVLPPTRPCTAHCWRACRRRLATALKKAISWLRGNAGSCRFRAPRWHASRHRGFLRRPCSTPRKCGA